MPDVFVCWVSDLSETPELQGVILDSFSSPNEEVKSAASYALGKFQEVIGMHSMHRLLVMCNVQAFAEHSGCWMFRFKSFINDFSENFLHDFAIFGFMVASLSYIALSFMYFTKG